MLKVPPDVSCSDDYLGWFHQQCQPQKKSQIIQNDQNRKLIETDIIGRDMETSGGYKIQCPVPMNGFVTTVDYETSCCVKS